MATAARGAGGADRLLGENFFGTHFRVPLRLHCVPLCLAVSRWCALFTYSELGRRLTGVATVRHGGRRVERRRRRHAPCARPACERASPRGLLGPRWALSMVCSSHSSAWPRARRRGQGRLLEPRLPRQCGAQGLRVTERAALPVVRRAVSRRRPSSRAGRPRGREGRADASQIAAHPGRPFDLRPLRLRIWCTGRARPPSATRGHVAGDAATVVRSVVRIGMLVTTTLSAPRCAGIATTTWAPCSTTP